LVQRLGLRALLVTRGANGMDLFEVERHARGLQRTHIPVLQRHEVFDVTGAGDTVAAMITLGAAAGLPLADAARLANAAAGIVVGTVGTTVADAETVARVLDGEASQPRAKVLSRSALAARVADARRQGHRIVFTNGCFDLLHAGHLHLLQRARALGELLIVGINDDRSVGRLKGPGRPLIPEAQRAEMLAALRFVDYVALFPEPTPLRLIQAVRPDVLVKGGDYALDEVVGREFVERHGGRVVLIPPLPGLSTSSLVEAIYRRGSR
jgi:D-beta-D-heptose 7-phosphate kinase/D-beta-D-heptose 1-phosphate adenosyltransferase